MVALGEGFENLLKGLKEALVSLGEFLLGGIADLFFWLVDAIESMFKSLFIPSNNLGEDLKDKILEKLPFISQISDMVGSLMNIGDDVEEPDFSITYYGVKAKIIDFTLFEKYLPIIHSIIVSICWATFVIRLYKRIPSIIGGFR